MARALHDFVACEYLVHICVFACYLLLNRISGIWLLSTNAVALNCYAVPSCAAAAIGYSRVLSVRGYCVHTAYCVARAAARAHEVLQTHTGGINTPNRQVHRGGVHIYIYIPIDINCKYNCKYTYTSHHVTSSHSSSNYSMLRDRS